MKTKKEAIVFLTGMGVNEPGEYLKKLLKGFELYCSAEGGELQISNNSIDGDSGERQVDIKFSDGSKKKIDIKEVYWGDLRPSLSLKESKEKILNGLNLLIYWTSSAKLWKNSGHCKYMMFNMIFTLIILIVWYLSVLVIVYESAIGSVHESLLNNRAVLVWGSFSLMLYFIPASKITDISFATKSYLENYNNMFYKVCGRFKRVLRNVVENDDYETITIISHSFGSVVSTEVLTEYTGEKEIRYITLGGPLLLISSRSERVKSALKKITLNNKITSWNDFYSNQDWLCTATPIQSSKINFTSNEISSKVPMSEKITGESHSLYFQDFEVIGKILSSDT